jgi:hypothetical protein
MKTFFEWFLWPFLKILWEPFSKKRSHWWHWKSVNIEIPEGYGVFVRMNPFAKPRDTFWSNLIQTNFGWKKVVIIEPINPVPHNGNYKIGFINSREFTNQKICEFLVRDGTKVALLCGPNHFEVFGVDEYNCPIPVRLVEYGNKYELATNTILL